MMNKITKPGDTPVNGMEPGRVVCITMNVSQGSFSAVALFDDGGRLTLSRLSDGQNTVMCPSGRMVIEASGGEADAAFDVMPLRSFNAAPSGMSSGGGGAYVLRPATESSLGGVKAGNGIGVDADGTIYPSDSVARRDAINLFTERNVFTEPLSVTDAASGGDALSLAQAASLSTLGGLICPVIPWAMSSEWSTKTDSTSVVTLLSSIRGGVYAFSTRAIAAGSSFGPLRLRRQCVPSSTLGSSLSQDFSVMAFDIAGWDSLFKFSLAHGATGTMNMTGTAYDDYEFNPSGARYGLCFDLLSSYTGVTAKCRVRACYRVAASSSESNYAEFEFSMSNGNKIHKLLVVRSQSLGKTAIVILLGHGAVQNGAEFPYCGSPYATDCLDVLLSAYDEAAASKSVSACSLIWGNACMIARANGEQLAQYLINYSTKAYTQTIQ